MGAMSGLFLIAAGLGILCILAIGYYFIINNPERVGEEESEEVAAESEEEVEERLQDVDEREALEEEMDGKFESYH